MQIIQLSITFFKDRIRLGKNILKEFEKINDEKKSAIKNIIDNKQKQLELIEINFKYQKIASRYFGFIAYIFLGLLMCLLFCNDILHIIIIILDKRKINKMEKQIVMHFQNRLNLNLQNNH